MLRKQQEKNLKTKASVQGIGYRATAMHSNTQMATAMKGATRAMVATSKGMDLGKMQNTMMEFEKESLAMEMKEEMSECDFLLLFNSAWQRIMIMNNYYEHFIIDYYK